MQHASTSDTRQPIDRPSGRRGASPPRQQRHREREVTPHARQNKNYFPPVPRTPRTPGSSERAGSVFKDPRPPPRPPLVRSPSPPLNAEPTLDFPSRAVLRQQFRQQNSQYRREDAAAAGARRQLEVQKAREAARLQREKEATAGVAREDRTATKGEKRRPPPLKLRTGVKTVAAMAKSAGGSQSAVDRFFDTEISMSRLVKGTTEPFRRWEGGVSGKKKGWMSAKLPFRSASAQSSVSSFACASALAIEGGGQRSAG
ncbi:hypothetical protein NKR23_g19 [Pleurostoma richardsiae]|uniref:Uncharacterized protein n=1 Tax=Pleurostoma richardsiae TaxID=41990 RepID=A0AA38S2Z3_9PEZI|nr:hypothetical protein NKR23_g19 [Pleurostoma richardsiae]